MYHTSVPIAATDKYHTSVPITVPDVYHFSVPITVPDNMYHTCVPITVPDNMYKEQCLKDVQRTMGLKDSTKNNGFKRQYKEQWV